MFPAIDPTTTAAWKALDKHYRENMKEAQLRHLFQNDPEPVQ